MNTCMHKKSRNFFLTTRLKDIKKGEGTIGILDNKSICDSHEVSFLSWHAKNSSKVPIYHRYIKIRKRRNQKRKKEVDMDDEGFLLTM